MFYDLQDLLFAQIQTMTSVNVFLRCYFAFDILEWCFVTFWHCLLMQMTGTAFDLRNPWKVDCRLKKLLEGSFFYQLIDMVPYTQKTTFQSFITDCYDKSSRTFTFGRDRQIQLYLGLQDIFAISGFPVDGS